MKKRIQIAVDVVDLHQAKNIVNDVSEFCDVIEVGTPLIKSVGVVAVSAISRLAPSKKIIADMKTMDNGALEVSMAIQNGADGVTIQGAAPLETIESAYNECIGMGKECYLDSLGLEVKSFLPRVLSFPKAKPVFHLGVDQQRSGEDITLLAKKILRFINLDGCALAGGISSENIKELLTIESIDTYILGSAISKNANPRKEAELVSNIIKEYEE